MFLFPKKKKLECFGLKKKEIRMFSIVSIPKKKG